MISSSVQYGSVRDNSTNNVPCVLGGVSRVAMVIGWRSVERGDNRRVVAGGGFYLQMLGAKGWDAFNVGRGSDLQTTLVQAVDKREEEGNRCRVVVLRVANACRAVTGAKIGTDQSHQGA